MIDSLTRNEVLFVVVVGLAFLAAAPLLLLHDVTSGTYRRYLL